MSETVQVVTGVISHPRYPHRVLLTQRTDKSDFPWCWESPGGKLEPGEGPVNGLRRELHEEVRWFGKVLSIQPFLEARFDPPVCKAPVRIRFYRCVADPAWTPILLDVAGAGWFTTAEMRALDLVPGNRELLDHLTKAQEIVR